MSKQKPEADNTNEESTATRKPRTEKGIVLRYTDPAEQRVIWAAMWARGHSIGEADTNLIREEFLAICREVAREEFLVMGREGQNGGQKPL